MRTALLDLDGTLVDSAALITEHLAGALATVGVIRSPVELRPLVGPPLETALPTLGLSAEQTVATIARYRATYDEVAATRTPVYPGVPGMLVRLGDLRLAVATSKPEPVARRIVEGVGISGHFALVGGAEHPGRVGKAAVIAAVLDRLGLDPTRDPVIMVGDRHHDVEGAAAHGISTIGVAWGYGEPGELGEALQVAADIDELATLLTDDAIWAARP